MELKSALQTAENRTMQHVQVTVSREKQKALWKEQLATLDADQLRDVLLAKMLEDFDREIAGQTKSGKLKKAFADKAGVTVAEWQTMSTADRKAAKEAFSAAKIMGKSTTDREEAHGDQ